MVKMAMRTIRLTIMGFAAGSAALAAALVGCNAVLGIGAASLDPEAGVVAVEAGSGDDGGADVDNGEAGPARGLACDYYCKTILQNCTGADSEFAGTDTNAVCHTVCQAFDVGQAIGPTDDNTLGCRIFYAEKALATPDVNCRFAGPLGGGKCGGDPCGVFCQLTLQYCSTPPLPATVCSASVTANCTPYASSGDCLADCRGGGDGGAGGYPYIDTGNDLPSSGDTLNCRMYHLENAYGNATSQAFHCPHTAQVSAACNDAG
jgi:hypothetical protein